MANKVEGYSISFALYLPRTNRSGTWDLGLWEEGHEQHCCVKIRPYDVPTDRTIDALHHLRSLELCNNAKRSDLRAWTGCRPCYRHALGLSIWAFLCIPMAPLFSRASNIITGIDSVRSSCFLWRGGRTVDLISRHSGSLRRLVLDQIEAYDGTWASVLDALKSLGNNLTQLGIRKGRHQTLLTSRWHDTYSEVGSTLASRTRWLWTRMRRMM
jgi:hypothetical protein